MTQCHSLIRANAHFLQQAVDIMEELDRESYTDCDPRYYQSGLGKHFRHVLDHYVALLDGLERGRIDYDARERDARLEEDPEFATGFTRKCIARFRELLADEERVTDRALSVCSNEAAADPDEAWAESTLRRELQFLISHTVHHYALIAVILRLQGHRPHEEFGVAPSTLEYQQQNHE